MAYSDAHEAARALALQRWGTRALVRAAAVVIERADELPEQLRAQVHEVTEASKDTEAEQ
jgi:hypothetical protein